MTSRIRPAVLVAAAAVVVLSVLVIVAFSVDAWLVLATVVALEVLLRRALLPSVFDSWLVRYVALAFFYVTLLQCVVAAVWLFDHEFPLDGTIPVTALVVALGLVSGLLVTRRRGARRRPLPQLRFARAADVFALGVSAFALALVALLPFASTLAHHRHVDGDYVAVASVSNGLDDGSHLAMFNDHLRLNRGILAESKEAHESTRVGNVAVYPQTLHAANAAIVRAFTDVRSSGMSSMGAYIVSKLVLLAMTAFLLARGVLAAVAAARPSAGRSLARSMVATAFVAFFAYYSLVATYKQGFYSFMPLVMGLILLTSLLLRREDQDDVLLGSLVPVFLVAVGAALSWPLVAPALTLALAVVFLVPGHGVGLRSHLQALLTECLAFLPVIGVGVLAVLAQVAVQASSHVNLGAVIDAPGGISSPSAWFYVFCAAGVVLFARSAPALRLGPPLLVLGGLVLSVLGALVYQTWHAGQTGYYAFKMLEAATSFAFPLAIAGWVIGLGQLLVQRDLLTRGALSGLAVLLLPLGIGLQPANSNLVDYVHGLRFYSPRVAGEIAASIDARASVTPDPGSEDAIYYDPASGPASVVGTNLLQTVQPLDACDGQEMGAVSNPDAQALVAVISACRTTALTIITSRSGAKALRAAMTAHGGLLANVTLETPATPSS